MNENAFLEKGAISSKTYKVRAQVLSGDGNSNYILYDGTQTIALYLKASSQKAKIADGTFITFEDNLENYYGAPRFADSVYEVTESFDVAKIEAVTWTNTQFDEYYNTAIANNNTIADINNYNEPTLVTFEGTKDGNAIILDEGTKQRKVDVFKTEKTLLDKFNTLAETARVKVTAWIFGYNSGAKYNQYTATMISYEEIVIKNNLVINQDADYVKASKTTDLLAGEEVILTPITENIPEGKVLEVKFNGSIVMPQEDGTYKVTIVNGKNEIMVILNAPSIVESTNIDNTLFGLSGTSYTDAGKVIEISDKLSFTLSYEYIGGNGAASKEFKMKRDGSDLKTSKIWNKTATEQPIKSIQIIYSQEYTSDRLWKCEFGNSEITDFTVKALTHNGKGKSVIFENPGDGTYFRLCRDGKSATVISQIIISYK